MPDQVPEQMPARTVPIRLGLRGLMKACAWCRRLRVEPGHWRDSDDGSLAPTCTHGICDDCVRQHFPEVGLPE